MKDDSDCLALFLCYRLIFLDLKISLIQLNHIQDLFQKKLIFEQKIRVNLIHKIEGYYVVQF